jgi:chromosomal replication initiation ATPase DnaA
VSCVGTNDVQLARLADAIAQRVGHQRFHVWFNNSTKMDLRQDGLEIAVPNDFISEWIGKNFTRPIQEAAHEVLGGPLPVRFCVVPELFEVGDGKAESIDVTPKVGSAAKCKLKSAGGESAVVARTVAIVPGGMRPAALGNPSPAASAAATASVFSTRPRLRHDMDVNVHGTLEVTRAFVPVLEATQPSAIVNILSVASLANLPRVGGYSGS